MQTLLTRLAALPEPDRAQVLAALTDAECYALLWDWSQWARESQLEPEGDWTTWLFCAGRGAGKTRSGAEWIRQRVRSKQARYIAFVAKSPADGRDVMVKGPAGIMSISPVAEMPEYNETRGELKWRNGALAKVYSSFEPDKLRGPSFDTAWCDELSSWMYPRATWDMLQLCMRIGKPKTLITTTPKPLALLKEIMLSQHTVITRDSTYANRANLAPEFFAQIVARYEGTSLGEQELHARLMDQAEGALWKRDQINATRVAQAPVLKRIVVGVDPAVSDGEESAETGIIVAGVGMDNHAYVLSDPSGRHSPDTWARIVVGAYHSNDADRVIAEVNNGGKLVEHTIRTVDRDVSYKDVHASRGKLTRAEPVAALYEQGRVHHVGTFPDLEDQLCTWVPGNKSPDRLDALVWAITELMVNARSVPLIVAGVSLYAPSKWRM